MAGKDRTGNNKNDDNYELNGVRLFDEYVNNGILTNDSKISFTVFQDICNEFFNFVITRTVPDDLKNKSRFSLIILPNDEKITYTDHPKTDSNSRIDAAGNKTKIIAEKPTIGGKFLSYDDASFTPNGMTGEEFYKNIGIGYKTLDKVTLPRDQEMNVAGLHWYFIDTVSPNKDFKRTRRGILYQLFNNYKQLVLRGHGNFGTLSSMKIICFQMDDFRSKMEALIDENLTMTRLEKIFGTFDTNSIPFSAAEILIEKSKSNVLWTYYLEFVNSVLRGYGTNDSKLLEIFTIFSKKAIFDKDNPWFEEENYSKAKEWFEKAEFCRIILSNSIGDQVNMNTNEEFAYKVGKIAGRYIWFRKSVDEKNNAVKDILTYSTYDRTHLRYVIDKIGIGIPVTRTKGNDDIKEEMEKYFSNNAPETEIDDESSSKNYSYFFYKGAYSTIAGENQ